MSTSSSLRQQFGAFCTNVPLGVRPLLEAPGLTTTLTAPTTALCVCPPLGKGFSSTGSTVGGVLKKRRSRRLVCCVCPPLEKGFPSTTPIRQGGKASSDEPCPTKLSRWRGSTERRLSVYLLNNCCTRCPLLLFVSMVVHDTSPKPFSFPHCSC